MKIEKVLELQSLLNKYSENTAHCQNGKALFLTQHRQCTAEANSQHRHPRRSTATPILNPLRLTMAGSTATEQRREEKERRKQFGTADNPCHGLRVDRMTSEQNPRQHRNSGIPGNPVDYQDVQQCNRSMAQNVDEVVAERLETMQRVVETECQDTQRTIRFVGATVNQRRTPEVIQK